MTDRPTLNVVVSFRKTPEGITASEPQAHQTKDQARRAAAVALGGGAIGVIAWSRSADPQAGEYGEPEILARAGTIPDWFDEGGGVE